MATYFEYGDFDEMTGTLTVRYGRKTISPTAFRYDTDLKRVVLPVTVDTIGRAAFEGCLNLTEINLGGVKTINEAAFRNCISLRNLDIANATRIDKYAFAYVLLDTLRYSPLDGCRPNNADNPQTETVYGMGVYNLNPWIYKLISSGRSTRGPLGGAFYALNVKHVIIYYRWDRTLLDINSAHNPEIEQAVGDLQKYNTMAYESDVTALGAVERVVVDIWSAASHFKPDTSQAERFYTANANRFRTQMITVELGENDTKLITIDYSSMK